MPIHPNVNAKPDDHAQLRVVAQALYERGSFLPAAKAIRDLIRAEILAATGMAAGKPDVPRGTSATDRLALETLKKMDADSPFYKTESASAPLPRLANTLDRENER